MQQDLSIVPFINLCVKSIIQNDTVPTNLLRVTIKTLIMIFELLCEKKHLLNEKTNLMFDPKELLSSLMNCQFDDHSNKIDQQELIWLNIQTLIIKVVSKVKFNSEM